VTRRLLLVALTTTALIPPTVAAQPADTISSRPLFTWQDGVLAGGFIGLTFAARPIDKHYALRLQHPRAQENRWLKRAAVGFDAIAAPGTVVIGSSMYVLGRLSDNERLADLGLHGTEALAVGSVLGIVLKGVFGRERPYVTAHDPNPDNFQLFRGFGAEGDYRSFPSGHALAGFAVASAVTAETSRWWPDLRWVIGPAMYGGASLIGLARMYNNRHWASDVVMGAAIGTFAGNKVVRYHHANPGNRTDEWLLSVRFRPDAIGETLALSLVPRRSYAPRTRGR
jgi:membrane-associated phospholipid phosphatase